MQILLKVLLFAPPLLLAVILHEIAHGWVANKLGDNTAKRLGRITLNPFVHIDPMMTLIVPGLLIMFNSPFIFGGAKPVPVNPQNFKNPRRDMALVAVAGPITNFILLGIFFSIVMLFKSSPTLNDFYFSYLIKILNLKPEYASLVFSVLYAWLYQSVIINLALGIFNLIPVPPLDGGRILVGILPLNLAKKVAQLEPHGFMIVIILLMTGVIDKILGPIIRYFITFLSL